MQKFFYKRSPVWDYILMLVGTALIAVSIQCVYDPVSMVTGGFTGLAIIQRCDRVSDSGWNSSVADEPCTQCAAFFGSFKDQRKTFYMENDRWNIVTFSLALYTAACGSYRW